MKRDFRFLCPCSLDTIKINWIDMEKVICVVILAIKNMHHGPFMRTSSFYHVY